MKKPFYRWKFLHLRNLAGRGLAPVVRFVCPRSVSLAEEIRFEREIVVYNDFEDPVNLTVNCTYGRQTNSWPVTLEPAGQKKIKVGFIPEPDAAEIVVTVHHRSVNYLEGDQLPILVISPGEA